MADLGGIREGIREEIREIDREKKKRIVKRQEKLKKGIERDTLGQEGFEDSPLATLGRRLAVRRGGDITLGDTEEDFANESNLG